MRCIEAAKRLNSKGTHVRGRFFVAEVRKHSGAAGWKWTSCFVLFIASLTLTTLPAVGADDLAETYTTQIHPLLVSSCGKCHGTVPTDNDLDLTSFASAQAILAKPKLLGDVADRLRLGDMPPKDAPQPSQAQREQLLGWITAALDAEATSRAGDPGQVTLRRLSNTEYDNAVRDLTGVDMRPTQAREFPVDSVGGEGFANVGDAMPVTPELVERYHQTARDVAARLVLLPDGFRFSPSTERPDWTEEALKPLRSFHARYAGPNGEPPLAVHLAATLKHRDRLTRGGPAEIAAEIAAVAAEEKLNATYLTALWAGLSGSVGRTGSPSYVGSDGLEVRRTQGSDGLEVRRTQRERRTGSPSYARGSRCSDAEVAGEGGRV